MTKRDVLHVLRQVPPDLMYARMIYQIRQLKGRIAEFCMHVLSISSSVDPDPLARIQYSYVYCEIGSSFDVQIAMRDNGIIDIFLKKYFLYWLEALSLIKNMSVGVVMIRMKNLIVNKSRLLEFIRDARRFIYNSSSDIYVCAYIQPGSQLDERAMEKGRAISFQ